MPWDLISAKRAAIHRVPMQIEAGAAAVGVFGFGDNDGMIMQHLSRNALAKGTVLIWNL